MSAGSTRPWENLAMPSLKDNFDELITRVRQGRELGHASFEPVYYLIFHPRAILDVKRALPAWTARLQNDGWEVQRFSIAVEIATIFSAAPLRTIWLNADRKAPLAWEKTNQALANALSNGTDTLHGRLKAQLEQLQGHKRT